MPIVKIGLFAGRLKELKKKIAKEITEVLVKNLQIPEEEAIIIFEDIEKHTFAQRDQLLMKTYKNLFLLYLSPLRQAIL